MTTKLHFTGAEVASHRKFLLGEGVQSMALNLSAYIRQRQPAVLKDVYEGLDMVLYSSEGGLDPMKVESFIAANGDAFTMIYGLRTDHPNHVFEWNGGDLNRFYADAAGSFRVGIGEAVAKDAQTMQYVRSFAHQNGIQLVTASSKRPVTDQHWDELILGAWVASAKQRELQVWDGNHVARYPRDKRPAAAEKHRGQLIALGVDPQAIIDDVTEELMAVSVRSWLIYGVREASVVDIAPLRALQGGAAPETSGVDIVSREARQRDRAVLPVLAEYKVPAVGEDGVDTVGIAINQKALRKCSSCNLSQVCPSFEAGSSCGFMIPMRITTKAELDQARGALLEIQMQRVMFGRYAEDVLSQGLDVGLSSEMERFFRMAESVTRGNVRTEQVTITATSESGVISRLFGAAAGEANTRLAAPVSANELTTQIFDAELIDPDVSDT